ncbi:hypothetical protein CBR_g30212 [Chara braunii]|uniref:Reverse transcriptase domain-containing protein n=1 Tax=Chara braunii TaxID=69332 RepID=A0A388LCC0_CHABU|nr:hypothetical protein CBR_g30212 [Chara braunii]|eukprot:GBG79950.1 hypothetical protein CBR_g30212 [Chara braunii]
MNITFQNFVNKTRLTQGMINFCVIVYMDDILVYSETYHGHAQHIEWTLGTLRDAGFKIALENSEFFLSEISFLGYVVTRGGLRPDSRKVAAVKEAPVPTSLTQVRAFLGLTSYYRRFIKGFAAIARPLTNLLRKDQPLSWDAEYEQAFATLKEGLATAPILIRPDPSKQFILITDRQPETISAILVQKGNDGREHVIEYASRTVADERKNDSTPQGECYAIWSACVEELGRGRNPPSQRDYLSLCEVIDLAFFQYRAASEDEEIEIEEESADDEEEEVAEEDEEEETPEEGSYSEHSEGEQSEDEEEEEQDDEEEELELEESEWEISAEELERAEAEQAEDPEAARKREEIAAGKRQLEFASGANLRIIDDPARDPEPPKPEDGDPAAETSTTPARRRRSRSPPPSAPTFPDPSPD